MPRKGAGSWGYAQSIPYNRARVARCETEGGDYVRRVGHVVTPFGVVGVDSWLGMRPNRDSATYMQFVWGGREYARNLTRALTTSRSIALAAGKFAHEIAGGADA